MFWSGENRARFLSERLNGLAVCCVDIWKIFWVLWDKTVAAVASSMEGSLATRGNAG